MDRPITLFTGQWADLPLEDVVAKAASFGYDGLELACWGDHFDVTKACDDEKYCEQIFEMLEHHGLSCYAISNHLVGQAVCDPIGPRHKRILPGHVWFDGNPEGVRQRAAEQMKQTARAAANFGVRVVNGFTGSSIWHKFYFFPPTDEAEIDAGYEDFAQRWMPILDVFAEVDVKFALEVHPTEIAYDIVSTERAIDAVDGHASFCFNFDPSHLLWQGIDPVKFIERFGDRIAHVHMKDVVVRRDGVRGILGSHLPFGDPARAWEFRSLGRGNVDFEDIIRALNHIGYVGPLSVEWEDEGMDREHGARESCEFVKRLQFTPNKGAFDKAFQKKE